MDVLARNERVAGGIKRPAWYWYFIVTLAAGFGTQVALYIYLRRLARQCNTAGKVVSVSGGTSTAAMICCCAHSLANVLLVLGATGVLALPGRYQVELF